MAEPSWKQGFVTEGRCHLEYFTHSLVSETSNREWVLFLHGFGQDYQAFEPLAISFSDRFQLLGINIFFHGNSTLEAGSPLEPEEWKQVMNALFQKLGIEKVHLIGFSMGCKFGFLTAQIMPERISSLMFLAPDGMIKNQWYRFATQSFFGRLTLLLTVRWMPFFRFLTLFLAKTGLIRASLGRFAKGEMGTKEKRDRVVNVWLRFRKIWPDWKILPGIITENQLPVLIVLGKFDTIISPKLFKPRRPEWVGFEWVVLEVGHARIIEKLAEKEYLSEIWSG